VKFAEALSIPVATSLNARGLIADNHRLAVGLVGGYPQACANQALAEADLVFFAGSHTGGQVTANWKYPRPGTKVIQLDIEPREIGRNYPCSPLLGDARTVLQQMLQQAERAVPAGRAAWLDHVAGLVSEWRKSVLPKRTSNGAPIRPERVCHEISRRLPAGGIVVCDTGHSGIWAGTMIDFNDGQRLIRSAGSLGWAFPAALGVKCAAPAKAVVCFAGDGAFYYHLVELETAARHGINVVVVVNNNSALSQEIPLYEAGYRQLPRVRDRELWGFESVDFARVAEGFGCLGIRIEDPGEIGRALERGLAAQRPVVIDVVTDHRVMGELGF
jgi:acetolactate synthase-1/2/3 large subunit